MYNHVYLMMKTVTLSQLLTKSAQPNKVVVGRSGSGWGEGKLVAVTL